MKKPYCPVCQDSRNGHFCTRCGSDLVEGIRVCECGYDNIWPTEKFCQQCGLPAKELPKKEVANVLSTYQPILRNAN
jgi:predicted amidophosphoribosyltransferase